MGDEGSYGRGTEKIKSLGWSLARLGRNTLLLLRLSRWSVLVTFKATITRRARRSYLFVLLYAKRPYYTAGFTLPDKQPCNSHASPSSPSSSPLLPQPPKSSYHGPSHHPRQTLQLSCQAWMEALASPHARRSWGLKRCRNDRAVKPGTDIVLVRISHILLPSLQYRICHFENSILEFLEYRSANSTFLLHSLEYLLSLHRQLLLP